MTACVWTVNVNNYFPEMTSLSLPNLQGYAERIGADFRQITERRFPDFPCPYEKMQLWRLGQDYDWNILFDADSIVHPDMYDVTQFCQPDTVYFHAGYDVRDRFAADEYFLRDGRFIGVTTNFVVVSRMCQDVWTPLTMTADDARTRTARWHIIDEYCFSRNLARFGLKHSGLLEWDQQHLFYHAGYEGETEETKREAVRKVEQLTTEWKVLNGDKVTNNDGSV